jgi:hypothetical protein
MAFRFTEPVENYSQVVSETFEKLGFVGSGTLSRDIGLRSGRLSILSPIAVFSLRMESMNRALVLPDSPIAWRYLLMQEHVLGFADVPTTAAGGLGGLRFTFGPQGEGILKAVQFLDAKLFASEEEYGGFILEISEIDLKLLGARSEKNTVLVPIGPVFLGLETRRAWDPSEIYCVAKVAWDRLKAAEDDIPDCGDC